MGTARVYSKGQITIPKAVRDATGIDIGDRVIVEARAGEVIVRHPHGVLEFQPPSPPPADVAWGELRRLARQDHVRGPGRRHNA